GTVGRGTAGWGGVQRLGGKAVIDLHAHVLPGVDDGPTSWSESVEMVRMAAADGIAAIAATSHMMPDGAFANRRTTLLPLVSELQERLRRQGVDVAVYPGGEVYRNATRRFRTSPGSRDSWWTRARCCRSTPAACAGGTRPGRPPSICSPAATCTFWPPTVTAYTPAGPCCRPTWPSSPSGSAPTPSGSWCGTIPRRCWRAGGWTRRRSRKSPAWVLVSSARCGALARSAAG